jgi:hypothetical protein
MYQDATATRLVATRCACCRRPLVDAASVEAGLGPDCRKKHNDIVVRKVANALVYQIAAISTGRDVIAPLNRLHAMGFVRLAARIAQRVCTIAIVSRAGSYEVTAPYIAVATEDWRRIRGRRFDPIAKINTVPLTEKKALWALLQRHYAGAIAVGSKGVFAI